MEVKAPIITRVVTNAAIVHNDLAIGHGKVTQTRGHKETEEQQIELNFIFRSITEIQELDISKYTRVSLHQKGQMIEYWYDHTAGDEPDNFHVIKPRDITHLGRWLRVEFIDDYARQEIEKLKNATLTS